MNNIDLDLDNENEMTFNVVIEGTRPGEPLCRLMIENEDMSLSMQGDFLPNNEVSIVIPPLKGMLNENNDSFYSNGQSYKYFFGEDENAEIITTFYEGTTYRIATSAGLEDNYMIFEILDQERNLLFSNTDFSNEPYWDFKVENTIECTIEAKLDPNKKLNGCAQLIIAFKKGN